MYGESSEELMKILPTELISYSSFLQAKICFGFDVREHHQVCKSVAKGVCDAGCDIMEIGCWYRGGICCSIRV